MISFRAIQELADDIAVKFDVEKIILFGSHAYGSPKPESDVDLLVVMEFDGGTFTQAMRIWSAVRPAFSVDLIVRTPSDTDRRYEQFDPLIREALDRGRLLYERRVARVG